MDKSPSLQRRPSMMDAIQVLMAPSTVLDDKEEANDQAEEAVKSYVRSQSDVIAKKVSKQRSKELPAISEEPGETPKHDYEQFDDFELPDDKELQLKEFSKNTTFNAVA